MEEQKLAVIFPGIVYHKDKPLLYYAARLAIQHGYRILSVEYHDMPQKIRGNADMMQTAAALAAAQSKEALQGVPIGDGTDLLLIGKSIGTIAAAQFASECGTAVRQIWYTPLEATFAAAPKHPCIAFLGDDDPWSDSGKLKQTAETMQIPMLCYPGCNHSLECGDVLRNLSVLQDVMQKTDQFLQNT